MRLAIGIEYDGSNYNGWQRQRVGSGVQEVVEKAASEVADEPVEITCAGRTDTGVHASGQVGHFDTRADRTERGWLLGINSALPDDVSIRWVKPVDDDFHARFSALNRSYRYRILNRLVRSALHRQRCWWFHADLDADAMHAAGQQLLGEHDFSAFRAAGCQSKSATRELQYLSVTRQDDWVTLEVRANAFLQHMVRNITGTLVSIGSGQNEVSWAREVLDSRDRKQGGITAPPQGLTLTQVAYPGQFQVPD
ncbi:MAG: tRNA pseudouridine(38-40) synthase TruA [Woeseiaceae bacterium]|nr:tRNA pseudouridine(38-40) synthase TruA [Woeseiaceae bacterium]